MRATPHAPTPTHHTARHREEGAQPLTPPIQHVQVGSWGQSIWWEARSPQVCCLLSECGREIGRNEADEKGSEKVQH